MSDREQSEPTAQTGDNETVTSAARGPGFISGRRLLRYLRRTLGVVAAVLLIGFIAYNLGLLDRVITSRLKASLAEYGIRAEIKQLTFSLAKRRADIRGLELFDAQSGERLANLESATALIRITDLYSFSLARHAILESLDADGAEVWIKFDSEGRSNFRNIRLPEKAREGRLKVTTESARVKLSNVVVHYGDQLHKLSGEARGLSISVAAGSSATTPTGSVTLTASKASFAFDGRGVNDLDINLLAEVDQSGAEIRELTLRSLVGESRLTGTINDWQAFRYDLRVTSSVDLTQISNIAQLGTALRGVGNFEGKISGEGTRYRIEGGIKSDALAADGIRLRAFTLNVSGSGDRETYDANARAVAELLTVGDFQLNTMQLAGKVMGTGTDFRWLGELRAAAARYEETTIAGLILRDVAAELKDRELVASTRSATISRINASGATIDDTTATDIRARNAGDATTGTIASMRSKRIDAKGTQINDVESTGVEFTNRNGTTEATVSQVTIGSLDAMGAKTGSLNIAGVRLSIHAGRIEGSTSDIDVGAIEIAKSEQFKDGGRLEGVRLFRPVFAVEPAGRYRASADLSLGGGMLGQINLGAARAAVVATDSLLELNDITADVFDGKVTGRAALNLASRGESQVRFDFRQLALGRIAAMTGYVVPLSGSATGSVEVTFPEFDFANATGVVRADFTGESGDASGRTTLSGGVALRSDHGLFRIELANVRTAKSELKATGHFSVARDENNLAIDLRSSDAAEIERLILSSGLAGDLEEQLGNIGVNIAGDLTVVGTVTGKLKDPNFDGRVALGRLLLNNRDVGTVSASLGVSPTLIRLIDGKLDEPDGGGARFAVNSPRTEQNATEIDATLDRFAAQTLTRFLPASVLNLLKLDAQKIRSDINGQIKIAGYPKAMKGNADIRFGAGHIGDEQLESMVIVAQFDWPKINIENIDARLGGGQIRGKGTVDLDASNFDFSVRAIDYKLSSLAGFLPSSIRAPKIGGTITLTASLSGNYKQVPSYNVSFDGEGRDVTINGRAGGTLTLIGRTKEQKLDFNLTTGLLGRPQVFSGNVDLRTDTLPTRISTTLSNADLTPLIAIMAPDSPVRVTGRSSGTINIEGELNPEESDGFGFSALLGRAEFSELTIQVEDTTIAADAPLIVGFKTNELMFDRAQFTGPGSNLTIAGVAAIGEGGRQNLAVDGKLNLKVLNGISRNVILSGVSDVAIRLGGSWTEPRFSGSASMQGASLATLIGTDRMTFSNLKGRMIFNSDQVQLESLSANLGGGRITATGGALLARFMPSRFVLTAHGDDVTIPYPRNFRTTADLDLEIRGTPSAQVIEGTAIVRRAEYLADIELADLINRRRESLIQEGAIEPPLGPNTQLNITVEGRDALVVRNNAADIVGSISLRVGGEFDNPVVSGRISASRGTLEFRNERYEIVRGFVDLPPLRGADPNLNIQGEATIRGFRVFIALTGPLSSPLATVRSEPSLPQQDVVALITTGNLSSGDSGASLFTQSGVGTAATIVADTLVNSPVRRATDKLFGLNRFNIDPVIGGRGGATPTARLTVGRQINRDLSITYSTNLTSDQNQVLSVEYRLSNRLSFVAQYQQGSLSGISSRNDNFNFEIRFKKRF